MTYQKEIQIKTNTTMFSSANNQVFRVGLRAALLLLVSIGVSVGLSLFVQGAEQIAHAAENRTFIISAYYSPLPDQQKYRCRTDSPLSDRDFANARRQQYLHMYAMRQIYQISLQG